MKKIFENKTILITGGCGSIGSEIVRQLLKHEPKQVRVFDNRETELFHLKEELKQHGNLRLLLGDIRDVERLKFGMQGVDIVFHAAALKHVPLCEYNPFEAMKTNVQGTQNVIEACFDANVDKLINISTDKVTNAINTLGATKLLAEKLVNNAEFYKGDKRTKFASVRFGNVLGSRGSVIDLFRKQIERKQPITITDPKMTRFIMSIPEAVHLVLKATEMTQGGEVFILKMPSFKLQDLITIINDHYGNDHENNIHIGLRQGEKMYEELMTEEESGNALETDDLFILPTLVNTPHHTNWKQRNYAGAKKATTKTYSTKTQKSLSKEELHKTLLEKGIID
ncbi:SDR family NAD(P)-dependent oxidoreductase [Candidatus Woesearchaeota archaeon]|nr:SDR family NAD(P)-dependent oxidoreductase [Candidatus Woesearchaeota archaeon]